METNAERALSQYTAIYERLFAEPPANVCILSGDWLLVDGAQLRASEVVHMSEQLERDYILAQARRRGIALRVMSWLR
jgi:hypothetical protein